MHFRLTLAAILMCTTTAFAADNWPEFRGPHGDGRSDARGLPVRWSETENVRWKTPIHGKGWSSPVIWGDQIWVTTADELGGAKAPDSTKGVSKDNPVKKVDLFAVCLDRKTGSVVHNLKLGSQDNPPYCHPFNSNASPTPAIEAGRVYAHFGTLGTWCVDTATGKSLWERRDLKCDHFRGAASSPVLFGDNVFLILDGVDVQYVVALDKATGKTAWKMDRKIKYKNSNPDWFKGYATARVFEVNGKAELVCPSAECTIAYDPASGAELWRLTHGGMNGAARPVAGNGLIYLTSGNTGKLLAMKMDLSGSVPAEAAVWQVGKNVPVRPSVLLVNDLIFMITDSAIATCVDAKTGSVLWSDRLDGEYSASPMYADGNVYAPNQSGKTFVFEASRTYNPVGENKLDAGCMASPAAVGDALYLRTKTHLYCIGKK